LKKEKNQKKKSKFKTITKWIILGLFAFLFFISSSLIVINNVKFIRKPVLNNIISIVNSYLIAKIELGDLKFHNLNNIEINDFALITGKDTLAKFKLLKLKIALSKLLDNKIDIINLDLKDAKIKLVRNLTDSSWNFEHIAPPSNSNNPPGKSPLIFVRNLNIENSDFILKDSTYNDKSLAFNPLDLHLHNLYINLAATVDLNINSIQANIKNIAFNETNTNMQVDSLKFNANLDSTKMWVDNFEMYSNDSKINLSAHFDSYSPLSLQNFTDINNAKLLFKVNANNFSTTTLKRFVYVPLKDSIKTHINFSAKGSFNRLDIDSLIVVQDINKINASGTLFNITNSNLRYILNLDNSTIDEEDLKDLIAADLSSLPAFAKMNIQEFTIDGNQKKISASFALNSNIGKVNGSANLDFEKELAYSLNSKFYNLNIEKIIHNQSLNSSLTGMLSYEGKGTKFENLVGKANIVLDTSSFTDKRINSFQTNFEISDSKISISELSLNLPNKLANIRSQQQKIELSGLLDLKNFNEPIYNFSIFLHSLNLKEILKNESLPSILTAKIDLAGNNFDIDKMNLSLNSKIEEITFNNLSILPTNIYLQYQTMPDKQKDMLFTFGEDTIGLKGTINFNDFLGKFQQIVDYSTLFFQSRYEQFILKQNDSVKTQLMKKIINKLSLPQIDIEILIAMNDLHLLSSFIPDMNFNTSFHTNTKMVVQDSSIILDFTNLKIGETSITNKSFSLRTNPFYFSGLINLEKHPDNFSLAYGTITLDELKNLNINGIQITNPEFDINITDSNFVADIQAKIDTLLDAQFALRGYLKTDNVRLNINKFNLNILKSFQLKNAENAKIKIDNSSFNTKNFSLIGNNNEKIEITGYADTNKFDNFRLKIKNFKLKNFLNLFPKEIKENFKDYNFILNEIDLVASNDFKSPEYSLFFQVDSLQSNQKYLGYLTGNLNYLNKVVHGNIKLNIDTNKIALPLNLDIIKFPVNLSISKDFLKTEGEYQIKVELNDFNLQTVSPFLPMLKNIKGTLNSSILVSGSDLENYNLQGNLKTKDVGFNLINNNLDYSMLGKIKFNGQSVQIDTLQLNNFGSNSFLNLNGGLDFAKNTISKIDLNVLAQDFIVLDEDSKKVSPNFYGKISFSTKNKNILVQGNPQNLSITGDLQINHSNITIANIFDQSQVTKTNFQYEIKNNKRVAIITTTIDSTKIVSQNAVQQNKSNISYMPTIDLNCFIPKDLKINIDLGAIGEINAIIGSSDPTIPLKYITNERSPLGQLYGELEIKEGSTLKSYRVMSATGYISFQNGKIQDPIINIKAQYDGTVGEAPNQIKYTVFVYITGTAQTPLVKFDYTINGIAPQGEQKKIEENALYLLLFGQLPGSEGIIDPTVVNKLGNAGISSLASRSLSDLLFKTGVIESADIQLNSQDYEKTKIQLKGKLFGSMNWSFGGNVSDLTKNNQIVIEVPLSINSETFNQLVWMIAYSTNFGSTAIDPDEKIWEIKLKLGGSW
jgi:hypothetical protein